MNKSVVSPQLVLFALYNLIYVVYMEGFLSRGVYLLSMIVFCGYCLLKISRQKKMKISFSNQLFGKELKMVLYIVGAFEVLSLISQLYNHDVELYTLKALLYLVLPPLIVFCIACVDANNYMVYVYILFFRFVLNFFWDVGSNFSISNLLAINWFDTDSSLMENSLAHVFCLMTLVFLYLDKKKYAAVATVLCIASFKRVSMLFCILSWVVFPKIPDKPVDKRIRRLAKVAFIISPFILLWVYSKSGASVLANYGIDIRDFSSSRYNLVNEVLDYFDGSYNGFGTINNYFATKNAYYAKISSIHCDMLVIYLEVSIIGVLIFVNNIIDIVKNNYKAFYMSLFMFFEVIVTHFLTGVAEWTLFYLFIFLCEYVNPCKERLLNKNQKLLEEK